MNAPVLGIVGSRLSEGAPKPFESDARLLSLELELLALRHAARLADESEADEREAENTAAAKRFERERDALDARANKIEAELNTSGAASLDGILVKLRHYVRTIVIRIPGGSEESLEPLLRSCDPNVFGDDPHPTVIALCAMNAFARDLQNKALAGKMWGLNGKG